MKEIPLQRKQRLFAKVKRLFFERWGDKVEFHRACLYMHQIGLEVFANELNERAIVQAGTMNWEIVPQDKDDGVSPTHFSFEWTPQELPSQISMAMGWLPEMHTWIALPERNEVVDFSTGTFPEFVKTLNMAWLSPMPPEFLWQEVRQASEEGHFYSPNREATRLAMVLMADIKMHSPLTKV